jgi:hypothetical protein
VSATILDVLAILERDRALHLVQPCSPRDLDLVEEALGLRLPATYRALLQRIGGGIFYDRHEVFGARRLILHDIELVPDILTVRRQLAEAGRMGRANLVPIHRCGPDLHLLDVSGGEGPSPVVDEAGRSWPDLPDFLADVVLPAPADARMDTTTPAAGRGL